MEILNRLVREGHLSLEESIIIVNQSKDQQVNPIPKRKLKHLEKEAISAALKNNFYNRSRAAKELGISERTLYRKLEKYELYQTDNI